MRFLLHVGEFIVLLIAGLYAYTQLMNEACYLLIGLAILEIVLMKLD